MGRPRKSKVEDWDSFTLRFPPGMRDKFKELAAEHGRSMNSELLDRLERSLHPAQSPELAAMQATFREELDRAVRLIQQGR